MSEVHCPVATHLRHTPAPAHGRSVCRSTKPMDGTRKRFRYTFGLKRSDCPSVGRGRVHAQRQTSIAQATGDRECHPAAIERVEKHQKYPAPRMMEKKPLGSEGRVVSANRRGH